EIEDQSVNRIWHHGRDSWVILTGLRIAPTSSLSPPNAGDNWHAHSTFTRDLLAARPVHPHVGSNGRSLRPIKRSRNSESRKPGAVRLTQLSIETICLGAHHGTSATQQLGLRVIFPLQCRAARFEGHHWLAHDVAFNRLPTLYRRFDLCLLQGEMIRRNCFALRSTASTRRLRSCGRCAQNWRR